MVVAAGGVNFVWEVSLGHVCVATLLFCGFCYTTSKLLRALLTVKVNEAALTAIAKQMEADRAMWSRFCSGVSAKLEVDWKPDLRQAGQDAGGDPS